MFRLSCNLYDNLEILAVRKANVELQYTDENGQIKTVEGVIKDLKVINGEECLLIEDLLIATKDIIKANDLDFR